ncbi:MAG TPA: PLP-dependent aminotransferase family protein [Burkholderiaceae bacterium]
MAPLKKPAHSATQPAVQILRAMLGQAEFHPHLPQQRRLYEAARTAILQQQLPARSKLPSTRSVAGELGIARNTVIAAFKQLAAEGYVSATGGSGTFVAKTLPDESLFDTPLRDDGGTAVAAADHEPGQLSRRGEQLTAFAAGERFEIQPFAPGDPDFSLFPQKLWQRIQNRVWRDARPELLDYGQAGGYLPLRSAIAEYLQASRSVKVSLEQVMITSGTQQSLDLCAQMLADVGDTAWVEDPCYWAARRVFQSCDLRLHPVAVDGEGIAPGEADLATQPKLIYVTPSHQYPTGVVMTLARRRRLLDIAAAKRAWILEDDYDSEFRYSGRPLAALQGLDTYGRVVYMGTFSKILYPGIKVGYLVVPPALVEPFKTALYDLQRPGQMMVQAALADFMSLGHFATHIRKIRLAYGAKRETLRKTLMAQMGGGIGISGEDSGLHLVVELPDHVDDVALEKLAAESGIAVKALSTYYQARTPRRGLLVGYAYVAPGKIAYYAKLLTKIIRAGTRK